MSLSIDRVCSGKRYMQISLIKYSNEAPRTYQGRPAIFKGRSRGRQLRLQLAHL